MRAKVRVYKRLELLEHNRESGTRGAFSNDPTNGSFSLVIGRAWIETRLPPARIPLARPCAPALRHTYTTPRLWKRTPMPHLRVSPIQKEP